MFFDDPKNVLSVARTHQQDLLRVEQRDRLARQGETSAREGQVLLAVLHRLALPFARGRSVLQRLPGSPRSGAALTPEVVVRSPQSWHAPGAE